MLTRHNLSAEYLDFPKLSEEWEFEKKQAKPKDPGHSHSTPGKKIIPSLALLSFCCRVIYIIKLCNVLHDYLKEQKNS